MKSILRDAGKQILSAIFLRQTFSWRMPDGRIALTFDDGPDPEYTLRILDTLAELRIQATFFLIGEKVMAQPALARAIAEGGHTIGGHSFAHKELPTMRNTELVEDLTKTRQVIFDATGVDTPLFRPPRGKFNLATLAVAARARYRLMHWSVTYSDYRRDGTQSLVARSKLRALRAGDIVLLHDNNDYTLEFLPILADSTHNAGLRFGAIPYR